MAISSAICSSFKQSFYKANTVFESSGGHTFKIALFDSDAFRCSYNRLFNIEEITNTSGSAYSAGGATLTNAGVSYLQQLHLQIFQM